MKLVVWYARGALVLFVCFLSLASGATISFDSFADGDLVTTEVPGLTFSNAIALAAGITLNEFEFPPRSGSVVVSDFGGPIDIVFATPVTRFAGYFTYLAPVTVTAYDAFDNPLASATSLFSTNLALSGEAGSSPNELLSVSIGGIARVSIAGDIGGGSFTLDDAQYTGTIPEPSSAVLALTGLGLAALLRRRLTSSRKQP